MNKIKKSIRDTHRLINRDNTDPATRQEQQRKLKVLLFDMEQETELQVIKKYQTRYQRVRFFEMRKAQRKYMKCLKEDVASAEAQNTLDDLMYILFYPKTFKYMSLYRNDSMQDKDNEDDGDDDEQSKRLKGKNQKLLAQRQTMYQLITKVCKDLNVYDRVKFPVKSLSVPKELGDEVNARLFIEDQTLLLQHWRHLVMRNKEMYKYCGISDLEAYIKDKVNCFRSPKSMEKVESMQSVGVGNASGEVVGEDRLKQGGQQTLLKDDFLGSFSNAADADGKAVSSSRQALDKYSTRLKL
ncbi:hypothetical protein MIR68_002558 [Amoeboaphelidium protococcarum]|nr:hypothetical protein MIR68_002558 [Amoeboaphelidium protococcarum]